MNKRLILLNPRNAVTIYGDYLWQPLSLAYLAGATPEGWTVELRDEQIAPLSDADLDELDADLVGITAFTTQATRAYAIASRLRARGIPVVMGGIHATMRREEASAFVDAVVSGEGETIWPQVLADLERGDLRAHYDAGRANFAGPTIRPDRSIFAGLPYAYASAQTSRGCPMACSFCSVTAFNGRVFRMRQNQDVVDELASIEQRNLLLVDDDFNGFSRAARARCVALLEQMAGIDKSWVTQVTINFGDDDELPRLARAAGCAGVFIGLESTDRASLEVIRKDGRSQRRGVDLYLENIARIRAAGIGVVGSFILGIDGQDMRRIADEILAFAEKAQIDGLNPTILTPLPGTDDFRRLEAQGRILFNDYPAHWERYTLAFPVHTMSNTTGAGLMRRYFEVLQYFRPEHIESLYRRTHATVSPEAAEHAWLWNRTWSNFALEHGLFRKSPRAAEYPSALPWQFPLATTNPMIP